jgi:hypothetical protein
MANVIKIVVVSSLLVAPSLHALTKKQVVAWTETLAAVSAACAYITMAPGENLKDSKKWDCPIDSVDNRLPFVSLKSGYRKPVIASGVTFAAVNCLFGWMLSKYTPANRYIWVKRYLNELQQDYLFHQTITEDSLKVVLQESGCEAHELPLVDAFLKLQKLDKTLNSLIQNLHQALNDTTHKDLRKKIHSLQEYIMYDLKRVRANEAYIKQQPQWLKQWEIHQQREIEREKMIRQSMQTHVIWHI